MKRLRVYIGFDRRESAAYEIAKWSILKHATIEVEVMPLIVQLLTMQKLFRRSFDPLASTEFTYTRFLVPYLSGYQGWALFMDCDMFFRGDIAGLLNYDDPSKALYCVQHQYKPDELSKMQIDDTAAIQTQYPRKNWSSFVLWNLYHPANREVTPDFVNEVTPDVLHQFKWLTDNQIGELPVTWNWLEGWNDPKLDPINVHYTRGIPGIHDGFDKAPFADEYFDLVTEMIR